MPRPVSEPADLDQWERLETYRQRYPVEDRLTPVLSLERSMNRRRLKVAALVRRLGELEQQLAEVRSEMKAVDSEIAGSIATGALLIEEILDEIRDEMGEAWSPTPIRGYRVWRIDGNRVMGSQVEWPTPRLTSTCLREIPGDDIPHGEWRCGPPACGVYAVKDLDMFPAGVAGGMIDHSVVGVVTLSGKVVEHANGYRGQHAVVVAVSASHAGRRLLTGQPDEIESLFRDPAGVMAESVAPMAADPGDARRFLEASREKETRWT